MGRCVLSDLFKVELLKIAHKGRRPECAIFSNETIDEEIDGEKT